ncbi:polysaccharide deacetylase family protein [Bacillus cereus group sp. BfR-BA-01380]|uniref:polysaccharide deacetylase family protein n=1 Tax=Bacillus cereus group sp. BfR-BA-01380 TaxID=2920324 RepID=UPI0028BD8789|nr:polysaccharide deacetylase family protein [Bacillus cereus group sp. BfR-BA-01380]
MVKVILLVLFLLALYWLVPYILTAGVGIGVLKRKDSSAKIAFTFDDGPNPIYTPQLLDLLKINNMKATFSVVGSKAEQYPELIERIQAEGHLIGMYNYVHKSNWIMDLWMIRRHLRKSASTIENITGERSSYYRPPWGCYSLA